MMRGGAAEAEEDGVPYFFVVGVEVRNRRRGSLCSGGVGRWSLSNLFA